MNKEDPLIYRHHQNWRQKGVERHEKVEAHELIFSSPLTIGKKDIPKVRSVLLGAIEELRGIIDETDPDTFMCLNIDWFEVH